MSERSQNGTITAHGRTWPLYERDAYFVDIVSSISKDKVADAQTLATEIQAVLDRFASEEDEIKVTVNPTTVIFMSPEDQAEKNALDEAAVRQ